MHFTRLTIILFENSAMLLVIILINSEFQSRFRSGTTKQIQPGLDQVQRVS